MAWPRLSAWWQHTAQALQNPATTATAGTPATANPRDTRRGLGQISSSPHPGLLQGDTTATIAPRFGAGRGKHSRFNHTVQRCAALSFSWRRITVVLLTFHPRVLHWCAQRQRPIRALTARGGRRSSAELTGTLNMSVILPTLRADHSLNVGLAAPPRLRRLL